MKYFEYSYEVLTGCSLKLLNLFFVKWAYTILLNNSKFSASAVHNKSGCDSRCEITVTECKQTKHRHITYF